MTEVNLVFYGPCLSGHLTSRVCSRDFPGRELPGIPGFFREFSREEKFDGISREFPTFWGFFRFPGNEKSGKLQTLFWRITDLHFALQPKPEISGAFEPI